MICLHSSAKINLFLYVTAEREDGFHDLFTLMTELELGDDLEFDFKAKEISVQCSHPHVPEDNSNLAFKAAEFFISSLPLNSVKKHSNRGVGIKINKRIPPGGGLGGGSSNAACVLKAMNEWYDFPFSNSFLMEMGRKLGADVPFFIQGGNAIARGTGEKLDICNVFLPYYILLVYPGFSASTAAVYKNVDLALTKNRKFNNNALLNICKSDGRLDIKGYLHNDLETAAYSLYPELKAVKDKMADFLHETIFMTGSGSSFFVLFSDYSEAENAYKNVSRQWKTLGMTPEKRIFLTAFAGCEN